MAQTDVVDVGCLCISIMSLELRGLAHLRIVDFEGTRLP